MIQVVLIDDHAAFRQPLAYMLKQEPDVEVVGEAASIAEARSLPAQGDVVVVDLDLPDGDGVVLIKELRAANAKVRVLVVSASTRREEEARAVEAGASGFVHKSRGVREIIDAVRQLGSGDALLSPAETIELLRLAGRDRERTYETRIVLSRLTPREREVLDALADGLNDKEIAQRLHISIETVRTHMVNLLGKLGVDSRLQALVFAVRHGVVKIR